MQKGETITGTVGGTNKEPKLSKKGQPFTGVKVDGAWYQVWGDHTGLRFGQEVELEVSWVAPDDGPVFCTMGNGNEKKPAVEHTEPRTMEDRVRGLEERLRRVETQLKAMAGAEVPEGMPF